MDKTTPPVALCPAYMKIQEVAKHLNISKRQINRLREQGIIKAYRLGNRCLRYRLTQVEADLEKLLK